MQIDPVIQTGWGVKLEKHFPARQALNSSELRRFLSD